MKISTDTIRRVQERADILEVVEDFLPLKKKGHNWWALSPFTDEKTPSFSVSPAKGIYKCFSTGKGGDAISFVMEMEGLGFIEAIRYLAKKYQIEIEEEELSPEEISVQSEKESLLIVLNYAKDFFKHNLSEEEEGQSIGLSYFRERGFTQEVIQKFDLGYSLNQWDALLKAGVAKGYQKDLLEKAGLIICKENKEYDRFRGRVTFPIHNISGRVIAFGARTLKKDDKPKYLNSPETEVYHKSDILYGIFQAKQSIRNEDNSYLVEGYTDVLSLYQAGIENVVASSGTSLTSNQIGLIKRYSQNVTILYDGDTAGINASLRGVDLILERGMNVRVVIFPEGEDPDSYCQKLGGAAFKDYLQEHSQDFILFKTQLHLKEAGNDPIKRAGIIRSIVESIAKIPDPIRQSVFYKECSNLLNIEENILIEEGKKIALSEQRKQQKRAQWKEERQALPGEFQDAPVTPNQDSALVEEAPAVYDEKLNVQEREYLRLLVNYGHLTVDEEIRICDYLMEEIQGIEFHSPTYFEIFKLYKKEVDAGKQVDDQRMLQICKPEHKTLIVDLLVTKEEISQHWERLNIVIPKQDEDLSKVLYTNILRLKYRLSEKLCNTYIQKIAAATSDEKRDENMKLYMEFLKDKTSIAKELGMVIS
ncbi:DNA primase [Rapidithrix thailandica]|uniref:DNA primase n=1 Tax=Rapidithrix thailandica TaxID=413964 RepID=A0AAW9SAN9_9BACT